MTDEKINPDELTEEASDPLGSSDSQEEKDDDWSPEDLSPEQRGQYDQAVKAVDEFIANHPEYRQTDVNRQTILDYLSEHDLLITPASLELAWEQLQDRLDVEQEQNQAEADESRVRQAGTALLARGRENKSEEEPPESVEIEPDEMPQKESGRRGKSVAWRNGRQVGAVGG